jgi:ABC-type Fe3+-siderophore transport system permease subunit
MAIWAGFSAMWNVVFSCVLTLGVSASPLFFARKANVTLPPGFIAAVVIFTFGTLFLGEVGDFYQRFWWWDVVLHTGSAVAFGMIGTILVLLLLRGDKLNASPFLVAVLAFSFAVSIGAIWEIFEFLMDQFFGLNMQKSGLVDTMHDLIVDCLGAFVGALSGYAYLKGKENGFLSRMITEFVKSNDWMFPRKNSDK